MESSNDNYISSDAMQHRQKHNAAFHQHLMSQAQVKGFGWTDIVLILAVFAIGFFFSMVLNAYGKRG